MMSGNCRQQVSESSSDDDDETNNNNRSSFPKPDCWTEVPCKYDRCDQEILRDTNNDLYCSRECYYRKAERDQIRDKTDSSIKFTSLTIRGRGGTGIIAEGIDQLEITVNERVGRIVKVKALKPKTGSKLKTKVDVDTIVKNKKRKEEAKKKLQELLNCGVGGAAEDDETSSTSYSDDDSEADDKN